MERKNSSPWAKLTVAVALGSTAMLSGMLFRDFKDFRIFEKKAIPINVLASKDPNLIPESDYFDQVVNLVKREYVDSIDNELKFATGAVKGMVGSLADIHSIYYDAEEFQIFSRNLEGHYQGIGADLVFEYPPAKTPQPKSESDAPQSIPRVTIANVVPGGPADKAGLKSGDWFETVEGSWVVNSDLIDRVRETQEKVSKKIWPQSKLEDLRKEIRTKTEKTLVPMRAWKRLQTGKEGAMKVTVIRQGKPITVELIRSETTRHLNESAIRPIFTQEGVAPLKTALASGNAKIDLRGQAYGDFTSMLSAVNASIAPGSYGQLVREKKQPIAIQVKPGATAASGITLIVDGQTKGVPGIFAAIMQKAGAKVEGVASKSLVATEIRVLPDGSGYTLNLGTYTAGGK